jgi:U4/U6.U5 tri-snRNP-associated protein 1
MPNRKEKWTLKNNMQRQEVKTDNIPVAGFEGTAAEATEGVDKELSSFVSILRYIREISKKAAKEEVRGRAMDDKNLKNYEPLDISKVVKIGRNATNKDKELLANCEVKLEYRDKHGRLLTAKKTFHNLCYQFHGHSASKKEEEKCLKQITREQAEALLASRQVSAQLMMEQQQEHCWEHLKLHRKQQGRPLLSIKHSSWT